MEVLQIKVPGGRQSCFHDGMQFNPTNIHHWMLLPAHFRIQNFLFFSINLPKKQHRTHVPGEEDNGMQYYLYFQITERLMRIIKCTSLTISRYFVQAERDNSIEPSR